jgi:parallel beta-helix repeat protein
MAYDKIVFGFLNIMNLIQGKQIVIMKYLKVLSFLFLFSFFIILNTSTVSANVVRVCASGCDSTTVQGGITLASAGDEVRIVDSREYNESVSINKTVTLTSNATSPALRPTVWNNQIHVITISANNVTISNLMIKQNSSLSSKYGIFNITSGLRNITIFNNSVYTSGGDVSYAIYLSVNNSNISYNNVTTSGAYGDGIYLRSSSNNIITGNNIMTSGSDAHGIYLYSSSNITMKNNNITVSTAVNGGLGLFIDGVSASHYIHEIDESNKVNNRPVKYYKYIYNQVIANNNTWATLIVASSNNITITNVTPSPWGMGILLVNVSNSNISYNRISTTAWSGDGIYLRLGSNNIITGNNITLIGPYGTGICLYSSSNNNSITRNNVTNSGSNGLGIELQSGSDKNSITRNNVVTSGVDGWGIFLYSGWNNNITGNNVTTSVEFGYGIYLGQCWNNNIIENNVTTSGTHRSHGIYLRYSSSNNIIIGNRIRTTSTTSSHGIYFESSTNNRVINTDISTAGGTSYDIYLEGTSNEVNYLINCTYNKTDIQSSSTTNMKLYNQYYLDVHVNNTAGLPVDSALVIANDTNAVANVENPTSNFIALTASTGWIDRQILTEFMANGSYNLGNYLYFNNYTVNASKNGYSDASTTVNLTKILSTIVTLTLSTGPVPIPTICEGYVELSIQPTFAPPSFYVEPSAYGLSYCEGNTVNFTQDSCSGSQVSSCTVTNNECVGYSFPVPPVSGAYTYYACIDMNSDGDVNDHGEQSSLIYTVGYSSLPEFGWMGIVQIMILASVIILLIRKNQN